MAERQRSAGYLTSRLLDANRRLDPVRLRRDIELNIAPHLPRDREARILEIGFGLGCVLDYLQAAGYRRYSGVETDEEAVRIASSKHPVQLVEDTSSYLAAHPEEYDVIVLRQVIAHLEPVSGIQLVTAVRQALRPGGVAVLQTFNAALPTAPYTLANDLTHHAAYTEHSLRQLLVVCGFESVQIFGGRLATRGVRGWAFRFVRAAYCRLLQLRFGLRARIWWEPVDL